MRERISMLKNRMLNVKPCLSSERVVLAKEAYMKYAGEAVPIFRAHVLEYILDHMKVSIFDRELIVGNQSDRQRCVSFHPEYMSAEWIHEHLNDFRTRSTDPFELSDEDQKILEDNLEWWYGKSTERGLDSIFSDKLQQARRLGMLTVGNRTMPSSNTLPNHERLLQEGLKGYISRCEENIQRLTEHSKQNQEKRNFWTACIISCKAVIRFSERHAEKAEELASQETDAKRKAELLEIAHNCRTIPANPPETFYQAVQFIWFMQLMVHIEANSAGNGFGRYDQYMYPFYKRDLEKGLITPEDALEYIECFYIKTSELLIVRTNADAKKFAGYPLWQILMVGGVDKNGTDATNDLTYLCLEAQSEVQLHQPAIGLRIHEKTPESLFQKGVSMIQRGLGNPAFFNDKSAIPICLAKGATLEEARNWSVIGCIEPHPGGGATDGSTIGGYVNSLKALELVLHNGIDPVSGELAGLQTGDPCTFTSKEQLMDAVTRQLYHIWDILIDGYNSVVPYHAAYLPVIFSSLLVDGCIDKGLSIQDGGAVHNYTGVFFCSPATLADSIEAINYAVFQEQIISMKELIHILDHNFEHNEPLRQLLLNRPEKFGNDLSSVDTVYRQLVERCAEYVQQFKDSRGGQYCMSNLSQTLNVLFGEYCNASPDGRKAGMPLSDNSSPAGGRDLSGPTSTVNSVAQAAQQKMYDGTLFNLRFDSTGIKGEKGANIIEGVIKTFFENNGEHIQINVVDDETLRKAQRDPEQYRGLVVRVAGYLAFFTDLDKKVQDDIIGRTAHIA